MPRPTLPNAPGPNRQRWVRWALGVAVTGLLVLFLAAPILAANSSDPTSYNDLAAAVDAGEVKEAVLDPGAGTVRLLTADRTLTGGWPADDQDALAQKLRDQGAQVDVAPLPQDSGWSLGTLLTFAILGYLAYMLWRNVNPAGGAKRTSEPADVPATRFADVVGVDEAVEELREVTRFLTDPTSFEKLGARVPKGFLLVGPPGTGKTLLARACAGEAGVPFYAISASDFVELFVGMGARRVRKLFAEARKHERAIVFIDELDSVGKARGRAEVAGGNDERESTLNALLVEMDGFHDSGVVVLGATNRPDVLDAALRRPGRFDRTIWVHPPDRAGREQLLAHYLAGKTTGAIDVARWAKRTPGMTGAEIEAVANDAALEAVRRGLDAIDDACMEAAVSTSYMGRERRSALVSDRDRAVVATHEAGHATAALMLDDIPDPVGASIVPRGGAGGATWLDGGDDALTTRSTATAQLVVLLAGRAAEQLVNGDITQGAHDDIAKATALARGMVAEWGMGELGPVRLADADGAAGDAVDAEVRALLVDAERAAGDLLAAHRGVLDRLRDALLEHETLGPDDLAAARADGAGAEAEGATGDGGWRQLLRARRP